MRDRNLRRLLRPASIAVFGGRFAEEVIRQNDRIGYAGAVWPVHPRRDTLGGRRCLRSVAELPAAPDASFIAVPAAATVDIVRQLAACGAGGAVCYASGFAEHDEAGAHLQRQLIEAASDMALVGPNCYGMLNYMERALLWPDEHGGEPLESGVAIISQSGNVSITMSMQQRSLPVAFQVATGNQAVLKIPDYLRALADDPRIKAIGLHFEGVDDVAALADAALYALGRRVPVVALKSGSSERGASAALSHTRSLAGADRCYDALFRRCGIARTRTLPQFLETLKLLSVHGALPQATIASISCSGGEAALVADLAAVLNLALPPLAEEQCRRLGEVLGARVTLANPLDYHTYIWGDPAAQEACFTALAAGAQELTLKVLDYPRPDRCDARAWRDTCSAFVAALRNTGARGAVVSTLPEGLPEEARRALLAGGVAPMQGLEECLIAVRAAAHIGAAWQRGADVAGVMTPPAAMPERGVVLSEESARAWLAGSGLRFAPGRVCDAADAPAVAVDIGFPVVVKAMAPGLVHKTEAGAVRLGLDNAEAVAHAVVEMAPLAKRFLVEAMVEAVVAELIVGVSYEPLFGPVMTVGSGGVWVELFDDAVSLLLPLQEYEVREALAGLRVAQVLGGCRGRPPADVEALAQTVLAVGAFAERHADELIELDINPLLVLPGEQGAVAVDALVHLRAEER